MVREFLLATILVLAAGCAPNQANPLCTQTGADSNGTPLCPLSAAQVKALAEAEIFYPGSNVIYSNAQGGALNVNGEPTSARVYSALTTSATPAEVSNWYDRTLSATGWKKTHLAQYQYIRYPPDSTYCELYGISAYVPAPTPPQPRIAGSYYQLDFSVPSTALQFRTSPDSSGNVRTVNPCRSG